MKIISLITIAIFCVTALVQSALVPDNTQIQNAELLTTISELKKRLDDLEATGNDDNETCCEQRVPRDCLDVQLRDASSESGIYEIDAGNDRVRKIIPVYCDMETDGGGWTVIQRRMEGSINFYSSYERYAEGFGLVVHEFWMGNDNIHHMTSRTNYELRVDLENFNDEKRYASYSTFLVESGCEGYKLNIGGYQGTAGDSMLSNDGQMFSTYDNDQDSTIGHCARSRQGAWWFSDCGDVNINGHYQGANASGITTVHWMTWEADRSLRATEMKIRPKLRTCSNTKPDRK